MSSSEKVEKEGHDKIAVMDSFPFTEKVEFIFKLIAKVLPDQTWSEGCEDVLEGYAPAIKRLVAALVSRGLVEAGEIPSQECLDKALRLVNITNPRTIMKWSISELIEELEEVGSGSASSKPEKVCERLRASELRMLIETPNGKPNLKTLNLKLSSFQEKIRVDGSGPWFYESEKALAFLFEQNPDWKRSN